MRTPAAQWCDAFEIDRQTIDRPLLDQPPRYNIAPTQSILAVTAPSGPAPTRQLRLFRWGLLPPWADDLSIGNRMINARSETVTEKTSFKHAFLKRRCLIPADGYLEWMVAPDGKQPYLAQRPRHASDQGVFALAGLFETNTRATGQPIQSCTILTTTPNAVTGQIHDRMPVILESGDHAAWLDPDFADVETLRAMLVPPPDDYLNVTAVSRRVNNARHDDPSCLDPA